jgi:hypothetical protein
VTLQLFDILLHSAFHMVIDGLTNCQSIVQCYVASEMLYAARLQLEEDTISYLSLIPDCVYSSKNDCEDFKLYLTEAHNEVKDWQNRCLFTVFFR